ncbi:MAG: hypothetical protein J7642_23105 [Cyanobacteria bacterium SBC]|nr:hypothetical protein [Cyanobacteria bacterium SBC]
MVFAASNSVDATVLANFREFMERLEMSDLEELYFCQLEQGAEENSHSSRLGFLSMMTDYGAKLGWKVETLEGDPEVAIVTTMVQLSI